MERRSFLRGLIAAPAAAIPLSAAAKGEIVKPDIPPAMSAIDANLGKVDAGTIFSRDCCMAITGSEVVISSTPLRVSCRDGDPGYVAWGLLNGDGKKVTVYLDNVEQKHCVTADSVNGMVVRYVASKSGNLANVNGELIEETVFGVVKLVIS